MHIKTISKDIKKKPNLFEIATSELSQDGFFTWLMKWAGPKCKEFDEHLHDTAIKFLNLLTGEDLKISIKSIEAERQVNHIDILVKINNEIVIAIEDKTYTNRHSDQLENNIKYINKKFYNFKYKFFIYLKTGNESISKLQYIREKENHITITRKDLLEILEKSKSKNNILKEFTEHLRLIEDETNKYKTNLDSITQRHLSAQGFFLFLQQELLKRNNIWSDWNYVSNSSGGFLGFWYHFLECNKSDNSKFKIYIQIQNSIKKKEIQLVVKLNGRTNIDQLYSTLNLLKEIGDKLKLNIVKPERYRTGETSTVAIVENPIKNKNIISLKLFLETLESLELTLNEFIKERKKCQTGVQRIRIEDR